MRNSFIEPIEELDLAAKLLDSAADALLLDKMDMAAELVAHADLPAIMEYAKKIVGKTSYDIHRQTKLPTTLPKSMRDPVRMPTQAIENSIYRRDGWRCRFCGTKVISRPSRNKLLKLFPAETHWVSSEFERHSSLYAMAASLDHILPHSRGGKNELSNFVTACYCCQFGRGQWTIEEVQFHDPRERPPIISEWDGLERIR